MANARTKTAPPAVPMVYTVADACAALTVSRATLWKYVKLGYIDTCKIGRRVCFPVAALQRFVEAGGTK